MDASNKNQSTVTDRDLIAGAAAAIGLHWSRYDLAKLLSYGHSITADMLWNPLVNRAHALELGAALHAQICYGHDDATDQPFVTATTICQTTYWVCGASARLGDDPAAAWCRALTEAAYHMTTTLNRLLAEKAGGAA